MSADLSELAGMDPSSPEFKEVTKEVKAQTLVGSMIASIAIDSFLDSGMLRKIALVNKTMLDTFMEQGFSRDEALGMIKSSNLAQSLINASK